MESSRMPTPHMLQHITLETFVEQQLQMLLMMSSVQSCAASWAHMTILPNAANLNRGVRLPRDLKSCWRLGHCHSQGNLDLWDDGRLNKTNTMVLKIYYTSCLAADTCAACSCWLQEGWAKC